MPPGTLVYRRGAHTLWLLDGATEPLLAQNLSLFAKLFIDNKSVCFDVSTFLYYLLFLDDGETSSSAVTTTPATTSPAQRHQRRQQQRQHQQPRQQSQLVGFFSKEKLSWDANNLACILVFPPWQRRGLGQLLMGASYAISRRDGRAGGPERRMCARFPLSPFVIPCLQRTSAHVPALTRSD